MTERIIVTVCDGRTGNTYDLEMSTSVPVEKLIKDILETIAGIEDWNPAWRSKVSLRDERMKRILAPDENLYNQGVWNGDYLSLELRS